MCQDESLFIQLIYIWKGKFVIFATNVSEIMFVIYISSSLTFNVFITEKKIFTIFTKVFTPQKEKHNLRKYFFSDWIYLELFLSTFILQLYTCVYMISCKISRSKTIMSYTWLVFI